MVIQSSQASPLRQNTDDQLSLDGLTAGETAAAETSWGGIILNARIRIVDGNQVSQARVTLFENGRSVAQMLGVDVISHLPTALVRIVEMDDDNAEPEVVFFSHSGGTHCCVVLKIAKKNGSGVGWSVFHGGIMGGLAKVEDVDGDGLYEIVGSDYRFLRRFSSYARSFAPLRIFRVSGNNLLDVTRERRFRQRHRKHLSYIEKDLPQLARQPERNGIIAGYVATKALVGEFLPAWETMMRIYQRDSSKGLMTCADTADHFKSCEKTITHPDFPTALMHILRKARYVD